MHKIGGVILLFKRIKKRRFLVSYLKIIGYQLPFNWQITSQAITKKISYHVLCKKKVK